jgi:hypothetical protein
MMVNVVVSRLTKKKESMTIISTKSSRSVNEKDIHAAYGIGEVIMGKSSIAISNLGIRTHHLKKGDLIGICKVVNSDDYTIKEIPDMRENDVKVKK